MRQRSGITRRGALAGAAAALGAPALAQTPQLRSPGVYINEVDAFPTSIVGVNTGVVAFVGPVNDPAIAPRKFMSFAEYMSIHGSAPAPRFRLDGTAPVEADTVSLMERSLRWFYDNGGRDAYAVGASRAADPLILEVMLEALARAEDIEDVTLLAAPDAIRLTPQDCITFQRAMLEQAARLGNRFAILDVHPGMTDGGDALETAEAFRNAIGPAGLDCGAAYYPTIFTTLASSIAFSFVQFEDTEELARALASQDAAAGLDIVKLQPIYDRIAEFDIPLARSGDQAAVTAAGLIHDELVVVSPAYKALLSKVARLRNLVPASAGVAGVYVRTDDQTGVWRAPANASLAGAIGPSVALSADESRNLNVPLDGRSVNPIRTFPGVGMFVWGARTLDGNSLDNRYVSVKRTKIFLRSSIETGLRAFVFEPNDANTWTAVRAMISNFLTNLWQQGALQGSSPRDAFAVQCGLGSTMTQVDMDAGRLIVLVNVALTRPAEFQTLSFELALAPN